MSARVQAALDRFDNRQRRTPRPRNELTVEVFERCRSLRVGAARSDATWQQQGYSDRDAWERLEFDPFAADNDDTAR